MLTMEFFFLDPALLFTNTRVLLEVKDHICHKRDRKEEYPHPPEFFITQWVLSAWSLGLHWLLRLHCRKLTFQLLYLFLYPAILRERSNDLFIFLKSWSSRILAVQNKGFFNI